MLGGLGLLSGGVGAALLMGAQVLWALTPGFLAGRAAGPDEPLPVDEKLRAQRRRIISKRPV